MKLFKKAKKGFTLIELVVVIAVIAILSAVSVVAYVGITNSAKKSAAEQKAGQIVTAIRAAALSTPEGYKEKSEETARYTVTINGKELTITTSLVDIAAEDPLPSGRSYRSANVEVINDMLLELENQADLKCDEYKVQGGASMIGVYKQGTSEAVWASF